MHVDKYGLPTQNNGDANDQLARVSMLVVGDNYDHMHYADALFNLLHLDAGIYTRYIGADPRSTSADQLISALAAFTSVNAPTYAIQIMVKCLKRFGFAQNTINTLDGSNTKQTPDFMLIRALPLFLRTSKLLYPLTLIGDVLLVLAAIAAVGPVWKDNKGFATRSPDDVDDNVIILTLIACRTRMPTLLSRLACKIYAKYRPWNYGCKLDNPFFTYHPVVGAMLWYHRAASGGNPEVAEAIIPLIQEYILN